MTNGKTLRAGVIGLGVIGSGVAVSLARRGRLPAVYDIRPDAADDLAGVPRPLGSPAEVWGPLPLLVGQACFRSRVPWRTTN
jgi:hypothetical protein